MDKQVSELLNAILLPLQAHNPLILPSTCVAEIVPIVDWHEFQHEEEDESWLMGYIDWRDVQVPLLSFEAACGNPLPDFGPQTHIVVLYAISQANDMSYISLAIQGIPKIVRLYENAVRGGSMHSNCAFIKAHIELPDTMAIIPHLENLERSVVGQLATKQLQQQ